MTHFFQRLTGANRVLLLVFVLLSGLALAQWWTYRPWARQYLRISYDDAYAFPVYANDVEFLADGQSLGRYSSGYQGMDSAGVARFNAVAGTWGSGNADIEGRRLRLPTHLRVDYTSVVEGRSYCGLFELPRRPLDSLLAHVAAHPALYSAQYSYPESQPGLEFEAGLGPGGLVLVWLKGEQYQAEVARFQARPCATAWPKGPQLPEGLGEPGRPARNFQELRQQVNRAELAHIDSFPTASFARLDSVRMRYRYQVRVQNPLAPATVSLTCLNGDEETLPAPAGNAGPQHRAVPDYLQYTLAGPGFRTRERSTVLDPAETRRAFAAVQRTCAPGELPVLLLVPEGENVRVLVRNHRQTIRLVRAVTYVGPN